MQKRRVTKGFKSMGMGFDKDDLVIITDKSFLVLYSQENKTICIEITFKERHMTDHEIDTYKKMIVENSIEDNLL